MTDFGFTITGDRKVALKFDEFPGQAHDAILTRITALTARLEERVRAAAPVKTGKLASTVTSQVFDNPDNRIRGRVTVTADFAKAATLEYGSHKAITVGLTGAARARQAGTKISAALAAPASKVIAKYQRRMNIEARRYLRGPLAAMNAEIVAELNAAVAEAARASP